MTDLKPTKKMPGFYDKDAKTKEEKLIVELSVDLASTTKAFVKLNMNNTSDQEMFVIIKDGALSYAGRQLTVLMNMLKDKKQVPLFLEECHNIFKSYLNRMREEHEKNTDVT